MCVEGDEGFVFASIFNLVVVGRVLFRGVCFEFFGNRRFPRYKLDPQGFLKCNKCRNIACSFALGDNPLEHAGKHSCSFKRDMPLVDSLARLERKRSNRTSITQERSSRI